MPDFVEPVGPVVGPLTYFLTFACYGTRLHGDPKGSVDRFHNILGTALVEPNGNWDRYEQGLTRGGARVLDASQRALVLGAIRQHCLYRDWKLYAAHVRSNHVHVVVWADVQPDKVMLQLKGYASRSLNRPVGGQRKWWAHHGSTKYLWKIEQIAAAVDCVANEQGAAMALFVDTYASEP